MLIDLSQSTTKIIKVISFLSVTPSSTWGHLDHFCLQPSTIFQKSLLNHIDTNVYTEQSSLMIILYLCVL